MQRVSRLRHVREMLRLFPPCHPSAYFLSHGKAQRRAVSNQAKLSFIAFKSQVLYNRF